MRHVGKLWMMALAFRAADSLLGFENDFLCKCCLTT
jgi:hypothetical protein